MHSSQAHTCVEHRCFTRTSTQSHSGPVPGSLRSTCTRSIVPIPELQPGRAALPAGVCCHSAMHRQLPGATTDLAASSSQVSSQILSLAASAAPPVLVPDCGNDLQGPIAGLLGDLRLMGSKECSAQARPSLQAGIGRRLQHAVDADLSCGQGLGVWHLRQVMHALCMSHKVKPGLRPGGLHTSKQPAYRLLLCSALLVQPPLQRGARCGHAVDVARSPHSRYLVRRMHFLSHGVQRGQGALQVCTAQASGPAIILHPCAHSLADESHELPDVGSPAICARLTGTAAAPECWGPSA